MKHYVLKGNVGKIANVIKDRQLYDESLLKIAAEQFKVQLDGENDGWRGEYWGKLMRGAVLVCKYTSDDKLYAILEDTVRDLISYADENGRLSSYSLETEFHGWDLWGRKYAAVGLEYFYEICRDETLKKEILNELKKHYDYIISKVGNGDGKISIKATAPRLRGLSASSILKSFVVLYELTNEKRYLDFAEYIISEGGIDDFDIFEAAYENKLNPCDYPVKKAYEMISCFEGILEYYKVTKIGKYRVIAENFAKKLIATEMTIVGGAACLHEWFNYSVKSQTYIQQKPVQETCVTVSVMLYLYEVYNLTGEKEYVDKMILSFENAYAGALNYDYRSAHLGFPFDSYSPLISRRRGLEAIAGVQWMSGVRPYGCCSAIGAAGLGVFLAVAAESDNAITTVNYYDRYEFSSETVEFVMVKNCVAQNNEAVIDFDVKSPTTIRLRIPVGSRRFIVKTQAEKVDGSEYVLVKAEKKGRLTVEISWLDDFSIINGESLGGNPDRFAVVGGETVYVADRRYCDVDKSFGNIKTVAPVALAPDAPYRKAVEIISESGEKFLLIDYASAGRTWDEESAVTVWFSK